MAVLPVLEPMLASTGPIAAPATDWAFEPKLDGWRALVYVDDIVTVRTRTGRAASVSLPEPLRGAGPPRTTALRATPGRSMIPTARSQLPRRVSNAGVRLRLEHAVDELADPCGRVVSEREVLETGGWITERSDKHPIA